MAAEFFACTENPDILARLSELSPQNPFSTPEYFAARKLLGDSALVIGQREAERIVSGCGAFLRSGRLNKSLEVTSVAVPQEPDKFWPDLLKYCRSQGVTELFLNTFGSDPAPLPAFPGETSRTPRQEFVLDLEHGDLPTGFSSNHARNIQKARKLGLRVRETTDLQDAAAHATLVSAAMRRRELRGEDVVRSPRPEYEALLRVGAAALFQARENDTVLASILVLLSPAGAYYQSAGSDAAGLSKGASHFLVCETSFILRGRGIRQFNLGGAQAEGLARFKQGFGSRPVQLEAAAYYVGGQFRRQLTRLARRARQS